MPVENDLPIGRIALEKKLITPEQWHDALRELPRMLGTTLVARGFLTDEQLAGLMDEERRRMAAETTLTLPGEALVCLRCGGPAEGGTCARCGEAAVRMEALRRGDTPSDIPQGRTFGKYVLIQQVGQGGFGAVYKAYEKGLGRTVALKFLQSGRPEDLQRFVREARLSAKLTHPHIVPLYEVGECEGKHYIAMEFIEGRTLDKLRIEPKRAAEIVRDAAEAVHFAHEKGIVHRDLKPQNLMMGPEGRVRVMDFGLAKHLEGGTTLTMPGMVAGTPAYMSPEQANAEACDARSDVYSLGATFYELLTGRPPFEGATPLEVLDKARSREPVAPRRLNPKIDGELETIVLKAMEKTPGRRYKSAKDLADDLRRHLVGEPILARPASPFTKATKWIKRHRAVSAVGAVVLAGAAALATVRASDEIRFREKKKRLRQEASAAAPDRAEELYAELKTLGDGTAAEKILEVRRTKQQAHARELVARAREKLAERDRSKEESRRWTEQAARMERGTPAYAPPSRKKALWDARARADRAGEAAQAAESEAEQGAHAALRIDPECADAKRFLAGLYFARWETAEAERRPAAMRAVVPLVEQYGGVEYRARMEELGVLDLQTRAEAHLFRYVEKDGRLLPMPCSAAGEVREIDPCSLDPLPPDVSEEARRRIRQGTAYPLPRSDFNRVVFPCTLPPGGYVVLFPKEIRYPVLVERGKTWGGRVEIPEEIPEGFVYVAPGPAMLGTDPETRNVVGDRREGRVEVAGFWIAKFETSWAEYLVFLNDRGHHSAPDAQKRVPRAAPDSGYYVQALEGRFGFPDIRGFKADWPVFGISQEDAVAYGGWCAKRCGGGRWEFRLPSEEEWEKAARGADGRFHVWGDAFDAAFSKMRDSRDAESYPEGFGLFPADESPYGARDMGGSVREWTTTLCGRNGEWRVVKGGSWAGVSAHARAAYRETVGPGGMNDSCGFRMAASHR